MSTIHLKQATPGQCIAGLTDFGPGRSEVFAKSADDEFKVHSVGPAEADVTEGSGGVWERLHYDWSDPARIVLGTTDSNVWGGASGYTYTFNRMRGGGTDVDDVPADRGNARAGGTLAMRRAGAAGHDRTGPQRLFASVRPSRTFAFGARELVSDPARVGVGARPGASSSGTASS